MDDPNDVAIERFLVALGGQSAAAVGAALARAFDALTHRAAVTLGEHAVALAVPSILRIAAERFPALAPPESYDPRDGIAYARERMRDLEHHEAVALARAVLTELTAFLGCVSGESLSPALRGALADSLPRRRNESSYTRLAASRSEAQAEDDGTAADDGRGR